MGNFWVIYNPYKRIIAIVTGFLGTLWVANPIIQVHPPAGASHRSAPFAGVPGGTVAIAEKSRVTALLYTKEIAYT